MTERLVLPVALWGANAPSHRISCVHMMQNDRNLITGSHDGQICIWDIEPEPIFAVTPRCMIFGHTAAVLCIADGDYNTRNTVVTSSDSGEMCLWNVDDGQCLESKKTQYTHTFIQSFKVSAKDCRLFCIGHYAEILVIDPKNFSVKFRLSSKDQPDWISSIHTLQPPQLTNIVIIGLSIAGIVRIWTITDEAGSSLDPIYDNDMRALPCPRSVQIISNPETMRLILIVCPLHWEIYDATDFKKLCSVEAAKSERWTGGNFITRDQVLVWSDKGEGHLFQVTTKRGTDNKQTSTTKLKTRLTCNIDERFLYPPKFSLNSNTNSKLLIRGDANGCITTWSLPLICSTSSPDAPATNVQPKHQQSLKLVWQKCFGDTDQKGYFGGSDVTSSTYLPALGKLACARDDGSILITTVTGLANLRLHQDYQGLQDRENVVPSTMYVLDGHVGKINCLLYPNSMNPRYDERHLVSGGTDFSVCLWDVTAESLLHRFNVHAGEINQLLVPPNECSARLQTSVCVVASDHSVSILNLSDRKCTLLASRHLLPVNVIKWRVSDETMIVGCVDGSAYVWHLEAGHLLKVLQGINAEETLAACDESIVAKEEHTNPAIELFKGLKRGNLSAIKSAAAKGLNQLAAQNTRTKADFAANYRSHPLSIQSLRANSRDRDSYALFFDIESIIAYLLHEPGRVVETVSLLLSILRAWGLEDEARKICSSQPSLLRDFKPACIGLISKSCYMAVLLPSYTRKLDATQKRSRFFSMNFSLARLTGQCLSHLLFVPSSPGLPLYASLRYTAVGLIGRGFTFWEPYLDVSKVLLGLLDLSCEVESKTPPIDVKSQSNLSNSRQAACDALSAIAIARPSVYITTIAREIAKYHSKLTTAHSRANNYGQQATPILVRSKTEVLRNTGLIIENMPLEVANLMVETMDITLHCIDHSLLENRGLGEAFPAITRFYMVSYCSSTRRIAVGTVTGNLAMYELRGQTKPQIVAAHKSAVSACSFSPDGKYLASYSAGDNKLCFWLTATGLFGLGNSRTRCVGAIPTEPVSADLIKSPSDLLRVARLIWVASKVVILMFIDEREYRYQVAS